VIVPFVLALSFIPNLKSLTPVLTAGTLLLIASFVAIGVIIQQKWSERPAIDELPQVNLPGVPLAVCAILYSYEGINLILPVESAMQDPVQFKRAFLWAVSSVSLISIVFSVICVVTFGSVTSGSVTAFLLQAYRDD
jgi:proton-coupled amino acid transporter